MGRPKKEKPNHQTGMYEVKITVGHTFDGKPIRKSFYSSTSKAAAKAKAEQYKINQGVESITGQKLNEPTAITFEKWALRWLETYKKGTVKEHTFNFTYRVNVEKYPIPYFKSAKISDIKQIDVQNYFNKVRNENGEFLAKSTLDKQKMILKSIFDAAIDNDLCYKNPVKNITYQHTNQSIERRVYSREQAEKVLEYAKNTNDISVVIMLETGIRRSELLGLQWKDINFEEKTMHIQRSVVQTVGKIVIDKPKTKSSDRIIPLSDSLIEYLSENRNSNVYLIGRGDVPMSSDAFSKMFKKNMEKMNKDIDCPILTPHELRHTYGTLLRENGVDIYTIQKVMGHSDISVTASIYVHNDLKVLREQMNLE